jgi:hypothetical protein
LAGPSCPWMSQRIIIETLPSSDRSRWMVAKTDLSPQRVVGDREPVIGPPPIPGPLIPIPDIATGYAAR